ncbi:MAG: glycosyltransferase family 2 protein [Nanoarchaeota archaeon]
MSKINVIIPMAGKGQRFINAGYTLPKPMLDIEGKPIIQHIIDSMRVPNAQFIFIVRQDHCDEHQIDRKLLEIEPDAKILAINEITQGSICTVLLAKDFFNDDNPVIIKDCDQIPNWASNHFLEFVKRRKADGAIVNIHTDQPHFSFSRLNSHGEITETAEKSVISNHGSVGIYYFAKGSELIKYANQMISKNLRVNNEFYTCPVYNQYLQDGKLILHYPISELFQFNTPEQFNENREKVAEFLKNKNYA